MHSKADETFVVVESKFVFMLSAVGFLQLGRSENQSFAQRSHRMKLFITDGTEAALTGQCVFFLRNNKEKPVTAENIHRVGSCAKPSLMKAEKKL